jgi:hypothetical protein
MNGTCVRLQAVVGVLRDLIAVNGSLIDGALPAMQGCTRLKLGTYGQSSGMPPALTSFS